MILVTGASGFIGKRLEGKRFQGDVSNYDEVWEQAKDCKGIVHLAAKSNKRKCEEDPIGCIESNLVGVYNILEVALNRGIWVLFISTFQVSEKNLYGISKLFGEELCRSYQSKGVKVKILRLPIVYGPGDKKDKVVTKLLNAIKEGFEPTIDTDQKFHFGYIEDVVKRIEKEVIVLEGGWGEEYSLTDLVDGIRKMCDEAKK